MTGERRHLFLSGPMGAGKTTVGHLLAQRLARPFIDLDRAIEEATGHSVAALFASVGEAGFRAHERQILAAVLDQPPAVVALGGGAVVDPANRQAMRRAGHLVTLTASPSTLRARLADDHTRPLLPDLEALLEARSAAYGDADAVVAAEGPPEAVADAVLVALGLRAEITVDLGPRSYPVIVAHQAEAELVRRVAALASTRRVLLVTDEVVEALQGEALARRLRCADLAVEVLVVPPGEASKSWKCMENLYDRALAWGVDRGTVVVALGGGVVGDLAGFLAATLLRGLPWVQVPTTLLAQVDSGVGGKTGINHSQGKNLIGAFHQPQLVFIDTARLVTLPAREVRAGLAEAIKHAAIADPGLLALIPVAAEALRLGQSERLVPVVAAVVQVKVAVVAADEYEGGLRKVLNFGHTLAHALEAARPGTWLHGEAVALGMACDAERSLAHGLTPAECARLVGALVAVGLDVDWRPWITDEVLNMVAKDKKIRREYLDDVVLRGLGQPVVEAVPLAVWRQALAQVGVMVEA